MSNLFVIIAWYRRQIFYKIFLLQKHIKRKKKQGKKRIQISYDKNKSKPTITKVNYALNQNSTYHTLME